MDKQKKTKIDIMVESAAKKYAEEIIGKAEEFAKEKGVSLMHLKQMREIIESTYIAGECHMYNMLLAAEVEKRKKKAR